MIFYEHSGFGGNQSEILPLKLYVLSAKLALNTLNINVFLRRKWISWFRKMTEFSFVIRLHYIERLDQS
jgi:hypothetical protein